MRSEEYQSKLKFIETDIGHIAFTDHGQGEVALFIHALPLSGYEWQSVICETSKDYRCLTIDQLGMGYSTPKTGIDTTFASQAKSAISLLDELNLGQVHLIGNDTGAGICQVLAAANPSRVKSLTITNCEVNDCWPNQFLQTFYESMRSGDFGRELVRMSKQPALAVELLGTLVFENPSSFNPELVAACLAPIASSGDRLALFQTLSNWQASHRQLLAAAPGLKAMQAPVQLVWGMADEVFDAEASIAWLERNLGNHRRTIRLEEGKLYFPLEHPAEFADYLLEFWRSCE